MMPATPKEKIQASARLKDPTHAKQDLLNVNSPESTPTKKRKRGSRSGAKRLRMSSSTETISPGSITSKTSKTSKTSHKRSHNKDPKSSNSATKSAMSRGMQQSTSPEPTQLEPSPKASSDQKAAKASAYTKPTNPLEFPDFPPSEFIFPGGLELGLFDCSSDERETSVSEYLPEQHNEVPTPYTPVLRAVSQYDQRIRSQRGGKCETWLARQMYDELDDVSTQIENIMRKIKVMLEKRGAGGDFEDLGDYFEAEESPGAFKGSGPENPLELSDGEDNDLFVGSGERACADESSSLSTDE